jgi:glycosyltransferase involved in cell wall biosynthesis
LVERGYQQVRQFSWERCARETLAVLEASISA